MVKIVKPSNDLTNIVYMTFFAAFLGLSGTTLVTLLTSFSDQSKEFTYLRQALISETAVNVIAGFTYFYFLKYLYEQRLSLEKVTSVRYLDWILTTPFLLLSFALFSQYARNQNSDEEDKKIELVPLIYIVILDIFMLIFGFLGETGKIRKISGFILGFLAYGGLIALLWIYYTKDSTQSTKDVFYVFITVWALYGIAYLFPVKSKNVSYNILDIISKGGFGMLIWITLITNSETKNV